MRYKFVFSIRPQGSSPGEPIDEDLKQMWVDVPGDADTIAEGRAFVQRHVAAEYPGHHADFWREFPASP